MSEQLIQFRLLEDDADMLPYVRQQQRLEAAHRIVELSELLDAALKEHDHLMVEVGRFAANIQMNAAPLQQEADKDGERYRWLTSDGSNNTAVMDVIDTWGNNKTISDAVIDAYMAGNVEAALNLINTRGDGCLAALPSDDKP